MNRTFCTLLIAYSLSFSAAALDSYTIDPRQTFPSIQITQLGMAIPLGRFNQTRGKMYLDPAAATGRIELSIATASISTGLASLEAHLRSPVLLDAEHYPDIVFVSDKLTFTNKQLVAADGALTLHGVTKPVHVDIHAFHCGMNPVAMQDTCDANASISIKRSDFGVDKYVPIIADQANIAMQISAIKD